MFRGVSLVARWRLEVLCPKCKVGMDYMSEVEKGDEVRISRFYRCPVCGFRVLDERIVVRHSSEVVVLEVTRSTSKKPITIKTL